MFQCGSHATGMFAGREFGSYHARLGDVAQGGERQNRTVGAQNHCDRGIVRHAAILTPAWLRAGIRTTRTLTISVRIGPGQGYRL